MLDDRHGDALDVGLLEGVGADQVGRHLAGDAHDRRRVEVGVGDRRDQVGRAGAGGGDGDAHLAGGARVALRHVAGALLVAHQVVADRCARRPPRRRRAAGWRRPGSPNTSVTPSASRQRMTASAPVMRRVLAIHGRPPHRKGFRRTPRRRVAWCGERVGRPPGRPPRWRRRGRRRPGRRWRCPRPAPGRRRPRWRGRCRAGPARSVNIRPTDRIIAIGLASPWPAMSGAEPCTGSKMPGGSLPSEADGARPEPAADGRGQVGQDVAEQVLGQDHVVGLRAASPGSSRTSRPARASSAISAILRRVQLA